MSLIGSLEQLDLANVLRRVEVFAKTGLLIVKQQHQDQWAEFYFRDGQLVCIGPVHANAALLDRLLQANLLSYSSLPQIMAVVNVTETNETRLALSLINEGYLSREILRAWSAHETSQMLQVISAWTSGEIYFEEDCPPPADRLLVALSISTLLDALPASSHSAPQAPISESAYTSAAPATPVTSALSHDVQMAQLAATQLMQSMPAFGSPLPEAHNPTPGPFNAAQLIEVMPSFATQPPAGNAEAPGMLNVSQLLEDDLPFGAPGASPFAEHASQSTPTAGVFGAELNITASTQSSLTPPQPVYNPLPPARIDTSFMTPELVLTLVDLSSLRGQNPQVQLTPDQWRLFSLIDGQSSLQTLCSALMAPVDQVFTVAGELMAIGLVMPLAQMSGGFNDFQPQPASHTGQMPQAPYAAAPTWAQQSGPMPAQAQWGNANMMAGGWVVSSQHAVSQPGYAPAGGYR